MALHKRFTIYDMMEAKGLFATNPANAEARDPVTGANLYTGPQRYPKMFYHPKGEEKIIVPAELITTPMGPKAVGEQREMISKIAANEAEEKELIAAGWWDHPAKGLKAAGKPVPQMGSDGRIQELEKQLAELTATRANDEEIRKAAVSGKASSKAAD